VNHRMEPDSWEACQEKFSATSRICLKPARQGPLGWKLSEPVPDDHGTPRHAAGRERFPRIQDPWPEPQADHRDTVPPCPRQVDPGPECRQASSPMEPSCNGSCRKDGRGVWSTHPDESQGFPVSPSRSPARGRPQPAHHHPNPTRHLNQDSTAKEPLECCLRATDYFGREDRPEIAALA
jgi:hypothetical protein